MDDIRRENTKVRISKLAEKHKKTFISNDSCFIIMNICRVDVLETTFKISKFDNKWTEKTNYVCQQDNSGPYYYVDTLDECIGELNRMLNTNVIITSQTLENKSELRDKVSTESFKRIFEEFIIQADKNAISKKAEGSKNPFGNGNYMFNRAPFNRHFGQGAPSRTPYISWWVVSIYYITGSKKIVIGIEENRYSHLKEMSVRPIKYETFDNRKHSVAVFYSTTLNDIDYAELYENFLRISEEVIRLGLE